MAPQDANMAEAELVKKARVAAAPPSGLATLPPHVTDVVLDLLAGDDLYHENGRRYWSRQLAPLHRLACVSRDWRAVADASASARALRTLWVRYKDCSEIATRSEMLEMRRTLTLRRVHLKRLIIEDLPDFGSIGEAVWTAALSHAPKLQSLDLDTGDLVRPPSNRVVEITKAAATHCVHLERLMFPSRMSRPRAFDENGSSSRKNHMRELVQAVYLCLEKWSKHGGLRHLRLTMRESALGRSESQIYLGMLTKYCPKIEILDGFAAAVDSIEIVGCEERWMVDLPTWERFCSTCDQFTMFDWVTVPFATRFFEIFAATPKPKLTNMTFSTASNWIWRRYFRAVGPATKAALEETRYGGLAKNVHVVLQACPNLKEVRVEWFDAPWRNYPRASVKSKVNPELFGDDFLEAAVRHCKKLTSVRHGPVPTTSRTWSPESIITLTDRSLRVLATLPDLSWVEIVGANITADGLFDLVINHQANTRLERIYYFALGDTTANGVTSMIFYDVLAGFLDKLVEYKGELPCASRPVMVQLVNENKTIVEEAWSGAYFGQVLMLVEKVQQKYPKLQLSGLVRDFDEEYGVMKRVIEFAFATASGHLPEWSEDGEDVEAVDDDIEGGVFVNRTYRGQDDDELDERLHLDSDEDGDVEDELADSDDEGNDDNVMDGEVFDFDDDDAIEFDDDDEIDFSDDDDGDGDASEDSIRELDGE